MKKRSYLVNLKSEFYCSSNQAVAAVTKVASKIFGRNWKYYHQGDPCIDLNRALHVKHILESVESISALTLAFTVGKMMKSENVVIEHHNYDISKKQGAGEYFV